SAMTATKTGSAMILLMMPWWPATSAAPSVTKLPVTCEVNRPARPRKPTASTKPPLNDSSAAIVAGPRCKAIRPLPRVHPSDGKSCAQVPAFRKLRRCANGDCAGGARAGSIVATRRFEEVPMQIAFDHVHLRTPDVEGMAAWFEHMLGAEIVRSTQQG